MRGSWIKLKVIPGLYVDSKLKGGGKKSTPIYRRDSNQGMHMHRTAQEQTDGIFFLTLELKWYGNYSFVSAGTYFVCNSWLGCKPKKEDWGRRIAMVCSIFGPSLYVASNINFHGIYLYSSNFNYTRMRTMNRQSLFVVHKIKSQWSNLEENKWGRYNFSQRVRKRGLPRYRGLSSKWNMNLQVSVGLSCLFDIWFC